MSVTSISEAKLKLYHLVRKAEGGEDVVLEYEGRPIARIQAIPPNDLAEERARAIDASTWATTSCGRTSGARWGSVRGKRPD